VAAGHSFHYRRKIEREAGRWKPAFDDLSIFGIDRDRVNGDMLHVKVDFRNRVLKIVARDLHFDRYVGVE